MAQIVHVERGDLVVFTNVGDVPTEVAQPLAAAAERMGVQFAIFEGPALVSVLRRLAPADEVDASQLDGANALARG